MQGNICCMYVLYIFPSVKGGNSVQVEVEGGLVEGGGGSCKIINADHT